MAQENLTKEGFSGSAIVTITVLRDANSWPTFSQGWYNATVNVDSSANAFVSSVVVGFQTSVSLSVIILLLSQDSLVYSDNDSVVWVNLVFL